MPQSSLGVFLAADLVITKHYCKEQLYNQQQTLEAKGTQRLASGGTYGSSHKAESRGPRFLFIMECCKGLPPNIYGAAPSCQTGTVCLSLLLLN